MRTPLKTPASATVANAIAVANAYMFRLSTPINRAVSWSSLVARINRPSWVRRRNSDSPTSTATAIANTHRREVADREVTRDLEAAGLEAAELQPALVGGEELQQQVLHHDRQPEGDEQRGQRARRHGAVQQATLQQVPERGHHRNDDDQRDQRGQRHGVDEDQRRRPPSTAKSPCARLTTRITPNMSESPVANSAYIPPSRTPCTIAFTSVMTRHP